MNLSAIVAMGKNNVIGVNGKLPWNIPNEYQNYLKIVGDSPYIIGRKNFETNIEFHSKRKSLIMTRKDKLNFKRPSFNCLKESIVFAKENYDCSELFIIGGAEIYKLTLPFISKLHLSVVDYNKEGDSYFSPYDKYEWKVLKKEKHSKNLNGNSLAWEYQLLEKVPDHIY